MNGLRDTVRVFEGNESNFEEGEIQYKYVMAGWGEVVDWSLKIKFMKERIKELYELYLIGIDRELFFKLILNITNQAYGEHSSNYANYLKIENWMELYAEETLNLNINEQKLIMFLNYMTKYVNKYIGKNGDYYYVTRDFSNEKRNEKYLEFESTIFHVFEVIT